MRVVPNLYPAFERQEVVVHTPRHARSLAELADDELALVARAWAARAAAARADGFAYVHASVNEGREAGASLAHSHSQLLWLREPPPAVAAELELARDGCSVCRALAESGGLVVERRSGLVLACARAGRLPYELLVAPAAHETDAFAPARLAAALQLVASGLRRLHALEGPAPANVWLHAAGHWHVEVVPRLTVLAGVELGAGWYVNPLAPEAAAAALRDAAC